MKKISLFLLLIMVLSFYATGCQRETIEPTSETTFFTNQYSEDRMLIVISTPSVHERYYKDVFEQIIAYDIQFAKAVMGKDNIIVLANADSIPYLERELPADILLESNVEDIWIRDFGTVMPSSMSLFKYRPAYLQRSTSVYIQSSIKQFIDDLELDIERIDLIIDGGNFVDNNLDKVVLTDQVFEDNPELTQKDLRTILEERFGITQFAILPQEAGDTTGHSDGMVMWLSENTLLLNEYEEPFRTEVMSAFKEGLPEVQLVEVPTSFSPQIWRGFASACGLNSNSIVTHQFIYVPVFGTDNDGLFIQTIQAHTDKEIVPVNAEGVCYMGGSVRCLGWQLTGENARKLIEAARD